MVLYGVVSYNTTMECLRVNARFSIFINYNIWEQFIYHEFIIQENFIIVTQVAFSDILVEDSRGMVSKLL